MKKNDLLASAKMTSKGQITVPKTIRTKLNLDEGNSVIFYEDENKNIKILNKDNCKVVPNNKNKQAILSKDGKNEWKNEYNKRSKYGDIHSEIRDFKMHSHKLIVEENNPIIKDYSYSEIESNGIKVFVRSICKKDNTNAIL